MKRFRFIVEETLTQQAIYWVQAETEEDARDTIDSRYGDIDRDVDGEPQVTDYEVGEAEVVEEID